MTSLRGRRMKCTYLNMKTISKATGDIGEGAGSWNVKSKGRIQFQTEPASGTGSLGWASDGFGRVV